MTDDRINTDAIRESVDIVQVVAGYVALKKDGKEYKGCCPFHSENTPSFYVSPAKGFVHCFGCGAHHDVIGFVQRYEGLSFVDACKKLGHRDFAPTASAQPAQVAEKPREGKWVPLMPVPDDAPDLLRGDGWTVPLWNPKRNKHSRFKPTRADAYRNGTGQLLGYVLRCEFGDGKITPTVTWCIGPDGAMQWCIRPFPTPRPLCGLDVLAMQVATIAGPDGKRRAWVRAGELLELQADEHVEMLEWPPVLIPEGEKCRAAGAGALPMYAAVTWPGGGKGVQYVDWSPLKDRDVVLWPDADVPGRQAMLGYEDYTGRFHAGVAQFLHRVGVRSMRYVDTEGQPPGWDIADALDDDWTPRQLATWAAQRVTDLDVVRG